jgi:WxL Interacting Protein, peptidoglycan binding domain/LysM domain
MKKIKKTIILSILGLFLIAPQITFGNSFIVSTIKDPDPYENNQSWFKYYEYPGATIHDSIVLRNAGDQTETVKVYATDANVNQAGSFTPKMELDEKKGLGVWTTLAQQEITIKHGETKEIEFEIQLPENIPPGQYFGSIIHEQINNGVCNEIQKSSGICTGNIQIKTRAGNRIYLTVPGETKYSISLERMVWKKDALNKILFTFDFINKGNIAFEPKAIIHIYNAWGEEIDTIEGNLGKSLPGSSTSPMLEWQYDQNLGNFTAEAEIYYLEDDLGRFDNLRGTILSDKKTLNIFIFPWTLAIYLLTISVLVSISIISRQRHYKKILKNAIKYTVKEDENIMLIAKKHHVRWKLIAKINGIKAPYILEKNKVIKIPSSQATTNGNK